MDFQNSLENQHIEARKKSHSGIFMLLAVSVSLNLYFIFFGGKNTVEIASAISLEKKSKKLEQNIDYIIKKNNGWGFQQANLTIDSSLDFLILPCEWFDGAWVENPYEFTWDNFFQKSKEKVTPNNFFTG